MDSSNYSRFLVAGLFLLFGCVTDSLKTSLFSASSIQPQFEKIVDPKQNLVFRFSSPVVKPEEIGSWDTTIFLQFNPRVSGQFKWSAIDELVFSPDKAFSFATEYSVSPSKALIGKFPDAAKQDAIRFSTPELRIERAEGIWSKDASGQVWISLHLHLNQAVLPDEVFPGMEVHFSGKKVKAEPETHFPSSDISLKINGLDFVSSQKDIPVKVNLIPDKVASNLKKWLKTRQSFKSELPSATKMLVYGLDVKYAENGGNSLIVRLNQTLADSNLGPFVQVPGIENIKATPHPLGMEVTGSFVGNSNLELTLNPGLRGSLGSNLKEAKTIGFQIGQDESQIKFASKKAIYLPKNGNRMVALNIQGVSEFTVNVLQIYPNNLIHKLRNTDSYYYDDYYEYEYEDGYAGGVQGDDYGTLVFSRTYRTNQLQKDGKYHLLPLNVEPLPGQKGVFLVKIADIEKRYVATQKLISITDLGLMAKQSREEVWVKCISLSKNEPQVKTKVSIIGKNNQALYTGETNGDGEMSVSLQKLAALGTSPAMILAENSQDFSYIDLSQSQLETSRFPIDGVFPTASGMQAVLLTPRNLYQPGEKIPMQVLLRDKNLAAVPNVPLLVKVISPMGKLIQTLKLNTSRFGQVGFDFSLPSYLATGSYDVQVFGVNRELLSSQTIHNEVFDPLPLEISAQSVPEFIPFGKDWNVGLQVDNMFGLPASKRPVQASLSWENPDFSPPGYENFNFNLTNGPAEPPMLQSEAETDEKGHVNLSLAASQVPAGNGLVKLNARIQVFDEAQVPVYKSLSTKVLTQKSLLGLRLQEGSLSFKKLGKFEIVSLNGEGKKVPGKAFIEIGNKEYRTVMEVTPGSGSGYRYVQKEEYKKLIGQWVDLVNGKAVFPFLPKTKGNYYINAKLDPADTRYVLSEYYVYNGYGAERTDEEQVTEGNVEIVCDHTNLKPGDVARVRFNCPFQGKLNICYEQNKILYSTSLETNGKSAVLDVPVTSEMAPNFYVSAVLTRPLDKPKDTNPLTVAYGYGNVKVTLAEKELKTQIKAPEKSGSGQKISVDISLDDSEESGIALAMVDEGILKITGYKMANPFEYFHRKKALDVSSFSMFGKIFASLSLPKGIPGGDGMYMKAAGEMESRQNVSVFLVSDKPGKKPSDGFSIVQSGKTKTYRAVLEVPAGFAGKVRLMAATFSEGKLGFAEKVITIADDITIKASLPDYLYPGDQFEGSVSYFNTSKKTITCIPEIKIKGLSAQKSNWPSQLTLKPGEVSRFAFSLKSENDADVQVELLAQAGKSKFFLSRKFSIKPPQWIMRHEESGEIAAGGNISLSRPGFLFEKNLRATIELSKNPFTRFLPAIQDLIRYPYGCLEQTVSAAFPLVYIPSEWLDQNKIVNPLQSSEKWQKNVFVNDAIRKISNLQYQNGGFAYWSGWRSHDYYSVYATHFLLEARQAGFSIDPQVLKKAVAFVEDLGREKYECNFYGYAENGNRIQIQKLDPCIPYALYVSSLAGRPNRAALLSWKSQPGELTQFGQYILACALMEAGDAEGFNAVLPKKWDQTFSLDGRVSTNEYDGYSESDWINSYTQEEAFVLAAMANIWPEHPMAKKLAIRLSNKIMSQSDQMSTQELGMAVVGLGKLMNTNAQKESRFSADLGPQVLFKNEEGKKGLGAWAQPLVLKNGNQKGNMYYFVQAQGISNAIRPIEKDAGMQVRKTFFNALGQPIDPSQMKLNDLVVVRLSLKSTNGAEIRQIALVDVVPSCLRIENKRLNLASDFVLPTEASEAEYLDIRRDRIHIFCTADPEEKNYYYSARVTAKGTYFWAPAEAQAMYQPMYFSRSGGKNVVVSSRAPGQISKG